MPTHVYPRMPQLLALLLGLVLAVMDQEVLESLDQTYPPNFRQIKRM